MRLERKLGTDHGLVQQFRELTPTDGYYRPAVYGPHVEDFLSALPVRDDRRKAIKKLRPKRVAGEVS